MDILTENDGFAAGLLLSRPLEFKLLPDAVSAGTIEGYAATFGGVDHVGDTIVPGAFVNTIAAHNAAGSAPGMLWNHNSSRVIGRWTAMGEDSRGLRVRGQINLDTHSGEKAHAHLAAGDVTGLSIGFQPAPGGQTYNKDGTRTLKQLVLHEVSVTPIPADPGARITQVKSLASRGDLEDLLRQGGLPRKAARKVAAAGWPALSGEEPDEFPKLEKYLKRMEARTAELKGLKL